jgi:hypothetical protein
LIVAAIERHSQRTVALLAAHGLPETPRAVRPELGTYLDMVYRAMAGTAQAHRTLLGEWGHNAAIDAQLLTTTAHVYDAVERYIAAAQQRGLLRADVSSRLVTQSVLGVLFADVLLRGTLAGYYADESGAVTREYLDIVLDGVRAPSE